MLPSHFNYLYDRIIYNTMGNRIAKHVWKDETWERSTYYLLDAQGNQVSIYEHRVLNNTAHFNLEENNIYGSSRVGSKHCNLNVLNTSITQNYVHQLGYKNYEFTNHLGNVLTVFTDKKIPKDEDNNGKVDGYEIGIFSKADYSPFGVELDGRTESGEYSYGFNGEERDDEIAGNGNSYNYGNRMFNPRIVKFFSLDALASKYPSISPYAFALNSPILSKDVGGDSVLFYSESGDYLGYSHDNQRYKGKNLLVVINDKDVKTFRKEYIRKRNLIEVNGKKLTFEQKEAYVAGLEAMGTSYDVNDFFDFYEKHKGKNKTKNGCEVEWTAQMDVDKSNPKDKGGSLVVDESTAQTNGDPSNVDLPIRKNGIDGDFHTHATDNPYMSPNPSRVDKERAAGISGRQSVIVSGDTFTVYQADKQGTSYIVETKKVQISKSSFKNAH